jgi:hypothetical protein
MTSGVPGKVFFSDILNAPFVNRFGVYQVGLCQFDQPGVGLFIYVVVVNFAHFPFFSSGSLIKASISGKDCPG